MTRARNSANLASQGNLFVDIANDRTGIGSIVPAQNLHVAGTAGFHADTTFTGDLYNTTWDRSDNSLKFVDNAKAKFGTGEDLQIYHDSNNSYIENSTNGLFIRSDSLQLYKKSSSERYIVCAADAAVKLFHNDSLKIETTAYGTNTTGTAVNDGLVVAGVATVTTMNVTGVLTYDDVTSVDSVGIITARQGVSITGGNLTINTGSPQISFTETNADPDYRIFVNGGFFTIEDVTNNVNKFEITGSRITLNDTVLVNDSILYIHDKIVHWGDDNTAIRFPSADTIQLETGGSNRLVINSSGNATFSGNLTVSGDLSVTGSTTQNNSVSTAQKTITLASGAANNAAADGAGIVVDAGSDTDKTLKWLDSTDRWTFTGGDVAANAFYGDGSNLTGIVSDKIFEGNTEVETVDTGSDGHIKFTTEGTEKARIDSNGRFGIGKNPDTKVEVQLNAFAATGNDDASDWGANGIFQLLHQGTAAVNNEVLLLGAASGAVGQIASGFGFGRESTSNWGTYISFKTHSTSTSNIDELIERVRINSFGQVGINTSVGGLLSVAVDSSNTNALATGFTALNLKNTNTTDNTSVSIDFNNSVGGIVGRFGAQFKDTSDKDTDLYFATREDGGSLAERMRITKEGRVGIGEDSPESGLHITAGNDRSAIRLENTYPSPNNVWELQPGISGVTNTGFCIRDITDSANRFVIDGSGNVGINDNSPETTLSVIHEGGGGTAYDVLTLGGSTAGNNTFPKIRFRTISNTNTLGRIGIFDAGATDSFSGDFVVELNPGTDGDSTQEKFRVTSDGAAVVSGNRNQVAPNLYDDLTGANQAAVIVGSSGITDAGIVFRTSTTGSGRIYFGDNSGSDAGRKSGRIEYTHNGDDMMFSTAGSERARITDMGDFHLSLSTGYSIWRGTASDQRCKFQFKQTTGDNRGFALLEERGDANCVDLFLSKSRGGNGVGAVNSGDSLGFIKFSGADGTRQHNGAGILAWTSGTIATGRVPTNLSFYTAPDSVSQFLERFRIKSAGGLKIPTFPSTGNLIEGGGSTVYSNAAINFWRQGNGLCDMRLTSNYGVKIALAGANNNTDEAVIQQDNSKNMYIKNEASQPIYFQTGSSNTTRAAIRHSGSAMIDIYGEAAQNDSTSGARGVDLSVSGHQSVPVYFGTEHNAAQKSMYLNGYWIYLRGHVNEGIRFVFSQSSGAPHGSKFQFKYNQCLNSSNSSTWNTSSDGRAKENVQTITNGIETIKKLRPVTYDWTNDYADSVGMYVMGKDESGGSVAKKENGYDTDRKNGQYGFIAQEYETVLPKDVIKDKYTLGGTELDDFRTMTNDSLLPSLTAALKEAVAKIEVLEAKVAALEGS